MAFGGFFHRVQNGGGFSESVGPPDHGDSNLPLKPMSHLLGKFTRHISHVQFGIVAHFVNDFASSLRGFSSVLQLSLTQVHMCRVLN